MSDYTDNLLAKRLAYKMNYFLDCTLATVDSLCMNPRSPKAEIQRQVSIAQGMLDCLVDTCYDPAMLNTRATNVLEKHGGSVFAYAQSMREKYVPKKPKAKG
jgi:hypothetical protein